MDIRIICGSPTDYPLLDSRTWNVASLLGRTGLGKCCRPSWTNQTWECCRPSWTNRTWEYCWTPDLKCCSFPCSS
ncbi:hypothetical protein RclHR1_31090001 [Rhizophagus clarus]|uniref:Uncharacterized protein n=1 Tax=Rhizophagus clarus TaxID=94130 RepID=A0A2Z6S1K3_9GLOM|nr:hypothetical protein RclHR1_31090001 [Rhizophagus clarus]